MKILTILVIILFVSAFFIISNNNLKMKNPENINKFATLYYEWILKTGKNVVNVTGNAIKEKISQNKTKT